MTTYFKQGLDVTGNVNLTGNITVGGDQNFGDSDTDSITFTSDITSHILPNTTNTYDLGADGKAWRNVHTGTLVFEGSSEDTNETTLSVVNPTADRVIILPDESGTLATQAYVTSAVATKDDLSELSGTTDDVAEGSTNLFYTDARADARIANNIIDEDNMATDSATRAPSQQSVKAYVDANSGGLQEIVGPGVVNLTTTSTEIVTTGTDAYTLANGTYGQIKHIIKISGPGAATITPASFANGTSVELASNFNSVSLLYTNSGWAVIAAQNITINA